MTWTQVYDPLHNWIFSTLVAALPILVLFGLLAGLRVKPHWCAIAGAGTAVLVAVAVFGMPVSLAGMSFLYGVGFGVLIGRILPITGIIVPFWLVRAMVGWGETLEVLPAILVVGASFSLTQYFWSNHVDSNLVDIAGGVLSLLATVVFLRFWRPKRVWRFADEQPSGGNPAVARKHSAGQIVKAWMPFAILSLTVLVWGLPAVKGAINRATTPVWDVPLLHNAISRAAPVVTKVTPEVARYDFNWLSATGTGCFVAAILAGLVLGVGPVPLAKIFWYTLKRMKLAVIAISFMLGLGFTTRYSGLDAVLGLAFTRSVWLYPFFVTFLGWLGVALTGSDTSSNALFGSLQRITSQQLGLDPILMCAANSAGGVMGKMVDAQSICVATAATNQLGNEGQIFRFVVWHSIALGAIVGLIVLMYAYVFPHAVPHGLVLGH